MLKPTLIFMNALRIRKLYLKALAFMMSFIASTAAFASDSGPSMPWDSPLQIIEKALSGTTAHIAILIAIVLGGIGFAYGEHGSLMRKGMGVIIGGSIAVGATSLYSTLQMGGALI